MVPVVGTRHCEGLLIARASGVGLNIRLELTIAPPIDQPHTRRVVSVCDRKMNFPSSPPDQRKAHILTIIVKLSLLSWWESRSGSSGLQGCRPELEMFVHIYSCA
jgi:hypothetical protein